MNSIISNKQVGISEGIKKKVILKKNLVVPD